MIPNNSFKNKVTSNYSPIDHTHTHTHTYIYIYIYIYQTPSLGQDITQGQFLSEIEQVWIHSFPSPSLVASPRLKNLVCPTIYPYLEGE